MLISKSKKMMKKNFDNVAYNFVDVPKYHFMDKYGIYIHVPFCNNLCSFCPFYKELYSKKKKNNYINAVLNEINGKSISGKPVWVYIGGGTPNTLSTDELNQIISAVKFKVEIDNIGIELHPSMVTKEYLNGLRSIGVTKISIGVESFSSDVLLTTGRKTSQFEHIKSMINYAHSIGLWVTIDMMIGFQGQTQDTFAEDITKAIEIFPNQITIYPVMVIQKSFIPNKNITENQQFHIIEAVFNKYLSKAGYKRKTIWTFGRDDELYDTSRDELVQDYVGFGPAAFSTYGMWKVVNPELDVYLECFRRGENKALVSEKTKATDDWRKFAGMIYECKCHKSIDLPSYINFYIMLLKIFGYSRKGLLTKKGKIFSHHITKTVVESLPFPLQNKHLIGNRDEYETYCKKEYSMSL